MASIRGFLRNNGLSLVLLAIFIACLGGQVLAGHSVWNEERVQQGAPPVPLSAYLTSGHLLGALFENWESEFLQMGMYVLLTVVLRQKGSAESKPVSPEDEEAPTIEPGPTPWPVRAGGLWRRLYGHSLSIAFMVLFALSFALHLLGSWRNELAERALQGEEPVTLAQHIASPQFWFESFQNWQSEFLAVAALVLLTVWLRERDCPQSKPVEAPHAQTGS